MPREGTAKEPGRDGPLTERHPSGGVPVELPCRLQLPATGWLEAELRLLGPEGALLHCPALRRRELNAPRHGTSLRLRLPGEDPPLTVTGRIDACDGDNVSVSLAHAEPERREALWRWWSLKTVTRQRMPWS